MTRALKVWWVGVGRDQRLVAATTKKEAAHAIGHSLHSFNQYAAETGKAADIAFAVANPGVGFIAPLDVRGDVPWEPIPERHHHVPERRDTKAEIAARAAERAAEREHDEQTRRACRETIAAVLPLLVDLGVHPSTVAVGESDSGAVGVMVPAETFAMLVHKAHELDGVMS